jgi:hypothetical protein
MLLYTTCGLPYIQIRVLYGANNVSFRKCLMIVRAYTTHAGRENTCRVYVRKPEGKRPLLDIQT